MQRFVHKTTTACEMNTPIHVILIMIEKLMYVVSCMNCGQDKLSEIATIEYIFCRGNLTLVKSFKYRVGYRAEYHEQQKLAGLWDIKGL